LAPVSISNQCHAETPATKDPNTNQNSMERLITLNDVIYCTTILSKKVTLDFY